VPALPAVPQVIRVTHEWVLSEDVNAVCRMFFSYSGAAPSNSDCQTFANAAMTLANTNLKGLMGADTILSRVDVEDLTSSTSGVGSSTHAAITGTRSGPVLPASTCMLTSHGVHRRFRGGHFRIYWPFGTQTDMTDEQTWDSAFISQTTTDVTTYIGGLIATALGSASLVSHVGVSYYHGFTNITGSTGRVKDVSTPRTTPIVDTIISFIAQVGIAIVRKRLLGLA